MNFKKLLLVSIFLLAILTIGAVGATGDNLTSDKLTVGEDADVLTVEDTGGEDIIADVASNAVGEDINESHDDAIASESQGESIALNGDANNVTFEDEEEGPNFEFSENEIIIDADNGDYDEDAVVVSGYFDEPTAGTLILSNGNVSLLNKTISDDDGWERNHGDSIYRIRLNDMSSFEGVNNGDIFELAFYVDGEDDSIYTSEIAIEVGEGYVKFVEWIDPNQFRIADAHDDVSVLETWDVIALYCPDGHAGIVTVTIRDENGNDYKYFKDIADKDENNLLHWNRTDLGMEDIGYYGIEVNVNDGEFKEEWITEIYIPIRYEERIYLLPCDMVAVEVPSEYESGRIIIEVDGMQMFNRTLSEFSSGYDDYYWTYDKVGYGEDDFNTKIKVYHIQNHIIPNIELNTYDVNTILIVDGRTMEKSHEITIIKDDENHDTPLEWIEFNFIENEDGELIFEKENDVTIAHLLIPENESGERIVTIHITKNGENFSVIKSIDIEPVFLGSKKAYQYSIAIDLTQFNDKDILGVFVDCFDQNGRLWEFAIEDNGDTLLFHNDYAVDIQVDPIAYTYGGAGLTNVSCSGLLHVEAYVINHTEADVTVNGSVITVSNLSAGQYLLNIHVFTVGGNAEENVTVTVDKTDSTLDVADVAFDYGVSGSINIVYAGATGITAVVVDHSEAVIKINGNKITLSGLNAGTYTLKVETIPDANCNPVVKTTTVKVKKVNTVLTATKVTTTYGTSKKLYVTLKDVNGNPLRGKEVYIKVNGGLIFAKTLSNGRAAFNIPKNLDVKTHKIPISFTADDNNYNRKTGYAYVVVKKANVKLTAPKKTYKVSQKNKKYSVILKSDKNVPINYGKVNLRVNGVTYSLKTNAKGVVTFGPDIFKKGTFKVNVKFFGNANFKARSVNTYIIVK